MENKDNKITIQCYAREIKTEKNSFIAVTSRINGKFYKIKFKKDCNTIPRKKGLFHQHHLFRSWQGQRLSLPRQDRVHRRSHRRQLGSEYERSR